MPITFDEVTAEITPPAPTSSPTERQGNAGSSPVDAQAVLREVQRVAERAARLNAD